MHSNSRGPQTLEPMLCNKRRHCNEKPRTATREQPPLSTTREKPAGSNEDPVQPKSKLNNIFKKILKGDSRWTQVAGAGQKKKGQAMIKNLKFSATFPIFQRRDRE